MIDKSKINTQNDKSVPTASADTWPPPVEMSVAEIKFDFEGVFVFRKADKLIIDFVRMRRLYILASFMWSLFPLVFIEAYAKLIYNHRAHMFTPGRLHDYTVYWITQIVLLIFVMGIVVLLLVKNYQVGKGCYRYTLDKNGQQGETGGQYIFKFTAIASIIVRRNRRSYLVYFSPITRDIGRGWRQWLSGFWERYCWPCYLGVYRNRNNAEAIACGIADFVGVEIKRF